jgi:hypothetical protein
MDTKDSPQQPRARRGITFGFFGSVMTTPRWQFRNVEGDSIKAECTACLFPKVCFEVSKGATPGAIIAELQRQFDEHCKKEHEGEKGS